jgi:hypothetical protein
MVRSLEAIDPLLASVRAARPFKSDLTPLIQNLLPVLQWKNLNLPRPSYIAPSYHSRAGLCLLHIKNIIKRYEGKNRRVVEMQQVFYLKCIYLYIYSFNTSLHRVACRPLWPHLLGQPHKRRLISS